MGACSPKTINLPPEILDAAKKVAIERGVDLDVILAGIVETVARGEVEEFERLTKGKGEG